MNFTVCPTFSTGEPLVEPKTHSSATEAVVQPAEDSDGQRFLGRNKYLQTPRIERKFGTWGKETSLNITKFGLSKR